jgi:hypothetical protein
MDSYFYRPGQGGWSLPTELKWNTQGIYANMSTFLPQATWDHIRPFFFISPFSWAGTDAGGFYTSTQPTEPTWTNWLEQYRRFGMGGLRFDYNFGGDYGTPGNPGPPATGGTGLWASGNDYVTPAGRIAGMVAATSTTTQDSSSITFGTIGQTRTGNNVTLTFTAAHLYGIHGVHWKLFASDGHTVLGQGEATMVFDLNGGSPLGGITNSLMDCTAVVPNATRGLYVTLDAYSTVGQRHSTRVQVA